MVMWIYPSVQHSNAITVTHLTFQINPSFTFAEDARFKGWWSQSIFLIQDAEDVSHRQD